MAKNIAKLPWNELYEGVSKKLKLTKDKNFKTFFMEREQVGYLFDPSAILQAYIISSRLQRDYDSWTCFDGYEGHGKSQLGMQFCSWVDPTFNVDRIHFESKTFFKELKDTKPGQAFLLDEGGAMAFSRSAMSLDNRTIIKIAQTVRAKNLLVAICCPNIHFIDTYLRYHRIRNLFHVKERGKYKGIIDKGIMTVLVDGGKYKNISGLKIHPHFVWDGYFSKQLPSNIDEKAYKEKKNLYINLYLDEVDKLEGHDVKKFVAASNVSKELSVSTQTLVRRIQSGEVEGKKFGSKWLITKEAYKNLISPRE